MASNRGRYFSARDMRFMHSINRELLDNMIEVIIQIFKISPDATEINIYGESTKGGRTYYQPIQLSCLIERNNPVTEEAGFGFDRNQTHQFKLLKEDLLRLNFRPDIGDLILYNEKYFEISDIDMEQLLGAQPEKGFSVLCNAHQTALSNINLVERN